MQLSELKTGDLLNLKSFYCEESQGNSYITFSTTVKEVYPGGILVDTICSEEGNPINFESNIVKTDLYKIQNGDSPITWEDVTVKRIISNKINGHIIVSKFSGKKVNRRNNYRVSVGVSAVARLGLSRKTATVMVRDVSSTGFAVVIDNKNEVKLRDSIRVTYDDDMLHISLNGICVRTQKVDDDRTLYGCRLEYSTSQIDNYVAQKQRKKAHG